MIYTQEQLNKAAEAVKAVIVAQFGPDMLFSLPAVFGHCLPKSYMDRRVMSGIAGQHVANVLEGTPEFLNKLHDMLVAKGFTSTNKKSFDFQSGGDRYVIAVPSRRPGRKLLAFTTQSYSYMVLVTEKNVLCRGDDGEYNERIGYDIQARYFSIGRATPTHVSIQDYDYDDIFAGMGNFGHYFGTMDGRDKGFAFVMTPEQAVYKKGDDFIFSNEMVYIVKDMYFSDDTGYLIVDDLSAHESLNEEIFERLS